MSIYVIKFLTNNGLPRDLALIVNDFRQCYMQKNLLDEFNLYDATAIAIGKQYAYSVLMNRRIKKLLLSGKPVSLAILTLLGCHHLTIIGYDDNSKMYSIQNGLGKMTYSSVSNANFCIGIEEPAECIYCYPVHKNIRYIQKNDM
jgi:hypothetical protein